MTPEEFIKFTVGKPWVNRAEGPDQYDCMGLINDSFRRIDNIELPTIQGYLDNHCPTHIAGKEAESFDCWTKGDGSNGDIVVFKDHKDRIVHVGRVLCGGVLHARGPSKRGTVKFDKLSRIKLEFNRIEFKRYANHCSA